MLTKAQLLAGTRVAGKKGRSGGARVGAGGGSPYANVPTTTIRVPLAMVDEIKTIARALDGIDPRIWKMATTQVLMIAAGHYPYNWEGMTVEQIAEAWRGV